MCRASRKKRGVRRTKWWNEELQKAVAVKKVAYRKILGELIVNCIQIRS